MKGKQFFMLIISFLLIFPIILIKPSPVLARNYAIQIQDNQDVEQEADLKSISMKDDFDFLYIKFESWKNWDLLRSNACIELYINPIGDHSFNNIKYVLIIMEVENEISGQIYDVETKKYTDATVAFDRRKNIGTTQIEKKMIDMKSNSISFQFYTSVLDDPGHYYDAAPDDQSLFEYVPGPNTELPKLDVSTLDLQAGDVKKTDTVMPKFTIMNKGEGSLDVELSSTANIRLDTKKITLGDYERVEIAAIINASKLDSQDYEETINVKSNFGTFYIKVTFFVLPGPKLYVDVASIDFGKIMFGDKKIKKINISNKSKGPIRVMLSTTCNWIVLNKTSFESKSEEVIVSLSSRTMHPGLNEGEITVSSNGGSSVISVTAEIFNPVDIDKTEFNFGEITIEHPKIEPITFTLKNQTGKQVKVTITASESWISVIPEITLEFMERVKTKITINLDKMLVYNKSYQGEVEFESKFGKMIIPVNVYLKQNPPILIWITNPEGQKEVTEKIITGRSWEKVFTIKNNGSGIMEVHAKMQDKNTVFRIFNTKFSLKKGETNNFKIKFDSTGLRLGNYKNTIVIESNSGNLSIPISIEVQPKPDVVIKIYIGISIAYINENQLKLDAPPYIKNGTTMVPLRFISDAFKAKIEWFSIGKGRIILNVPSKKIQLDVGEPVAYINGAKLLLQVPPEIKNGRTFVPLRFIAEALGAKITWKADTQQITIIYVIEE